MENNIRIYESKDGKRSVELKLIADTLWLSLNQISELFGRDKSVVAKHLKNTFKEEELDKDSVVAKFATTAADGKIYQVEYYNLDAIISVGYRVNSKQGTDFRKWANEVLKDHLVKGYSLNDKRLAEKGFKEIEESLSLISNTLQKHNLLDDLSISAISVVRDYAKSWSLLLKYDEDRLEIPQSSYEPIDVFAYGKAKDLIKDLLRELKKKGEATDLFGKLKGQELEGIIGNLNQTFDSNPLYPTNFERAAHLLYFVIKDHPFVDGNKRIGSFLFLLYLEKVNISLKKVSDNTLVALALLVAESEPKQKDLIIKLIVNLIA